MLVPNTSGETEASLMKLPAFPLHTKQEQNPADVVVRGTAAGVVCGAWVSRAPEPCFPAVLNYCLPGCCARRSSAPPPTAGCVRNTHTLAHPSPFSLETHTVRKDRDYDAIEHLPWFCLHVFFLKRFTFIIFIYVCMHVSALVKVIPVNTGKDQKNWDYRHLWAVLCRC